MIELIVGLIIGVPLVICMRRLIGIKRRMLDVRAKHRDLFYDGAEQIIQWDDISTERLTKLSAMSEDLGTRRAQMMLFQAVKELNRSDKSVIPGSKPMAGNLSPDRRKLWLDTYFHWMIATCAQGSLMGVASLLELMEYVSPEETAERTETFLSRPPIEAPAH